MGHAIRDVEYVTYYKINILTLQDMSVCIKTYLFKHTVILVYSQKHCFDIALNSAANFKLYSKI